MSYPTPFKYVHPSRLDTHQFPTAWPSVSNVSLQIIEPGTIPKLTEETEELGEIIFGMGYIQDYCEKKGKSVDKELERLAVHGMCHIMGYDHELDADYAKMHKREMEIMKKLKELKEIEAEENLRSEIFAPSTGAVSATDIELALATGENGVQVLKKKVVKKVKQTTSVKVVKKTKKKKKDDSSSSSSSSSSSGESSSSSSSS